MTGQTMIHPETGAVLSRRRRLETVTYMDQTRAVEVEAYFPDDDGDGVFIGSDASPLEAAMLDVKNSYREDMRCLAKRVRSSTRMTQKEASLLLTGSPNSFSKYERGEAVPSWPTSILLKLIDRDPGLIDTIRG